MNFLLKKQIKFIRKECNIISKLQKIVIFVNNYFDKTIVQLIICYLLKDNK